MPSTYKTPGVYIEEISTLPASIAQVATAIPAFVGYTEVAKKNGKELINVPTKIDSLLEFEEYFGKGPKDIEITVDLKSDNSVDEVSFSTKYNLYDSLRMFFSNGGGECYIVAVDTFEKADASKYKKTLIDGLAKLRKEDEPTLILFPDAVNLLTAVELGDLQKAALKQCNDLQDRFCIFDLLNGDDELDVETDGATPDLAFRNNVGVQYLKYGAAYYPNLRTSLSFEFGYEQINFRKNKLDVALQGLTTETTYIEHMDAVVADANSFSDLVYGDGSSDVLSNPDGKYDKLMHDPIQKEDLFNGYSTIPEKYLTASAGRNQVIARAEYIRYMIDGLASLSITDTDDEDLDGDGVSSNDLQTILNKYINDTDSPVYDVLKKLYLYDLSYNTKGRDGTLASDDPSLTANPNKLGEIVADGDTEYKIGTLAYDLSGIDQGYNDDDSIYGSGTPDTQKAAAIASESAYQALYEEIVSIYRAFEAEISLRKENLELLLQETNVIYANAVKAIKKEGIVLPPSGAIAGVYAATDNERGVWVAPANRSINSVIGPKVNITTKEQENLNVDVTAGKSINAIRSFTGKGTLVWGARTLAGNSNEWRYVPVRRLFNMIEESVKKATEFVVFEPNDKNTWVRTKAMIENFLNQIWKAGGLAGAKAEHAYIVKVGLGETITAQDILEGRMIVEIHLAAVRPAEFIVLRFMHKLQES
jgi:hypothetical protein